MAQKRYNEFQSPILSLDTPYALMGALSAGRYRGFDTLVYPGSGNAVTFNHSATGLTRVNSSGAFTNPLGKLLTPQGIGIEEDAAIGPLTVADNTGNTASRIDLLVCNHSHSLVTVGGVAATYSIIQGPTNSYTAPALISPTTQMIIGEIHLLGTSSVATLYSSGLLEYRPAAAPYFSDVPVARLAEENLFTEYNQFGARVDEALHQDWVIGSGGTANHLKIATGTNWYQMTAQMAPTTFKIYAIQQPKSSNNPGGRNGVKIRLSIDPNGGDDFYFAHSNVAISIAPGYSPILIPKKFRNVAVNMPTYPYEGLVGGITTLVDLMYSLEMDAWFVTNVVDVLDTQPGTIYAKDLIFGAVNMPAVAIPNTSDLFASTGAGHNVANLTTNDVGTFLLNAGKLKILRAGFYKLEANLFLNMGFQVSSGIPRGEADFCANSNVNGNVSITGTYLDKRIGCLGHEHLTTTALITIAANEEFNLDFQLSNPPGANLGAGTVYGELIITKLA